jgi:hypothetical protein
VAYLKEKESYTVKGGKEQISNTWAPLLLTEKQKTGRSKAA